MQRVWAPVRSWRARTKNSATPWQRSGNMIGHRSSSLKHPTTSVCRVTSRGGTYPSRKCPSEKRCERCGRTTRRHGRRKGISFRRGLSERLDREVTREFTSAEKEAAWPPRQNHFRQEVPPRRT